MPPKVDARLRPGRSVQSKPNFANSQQLTTMARPNQTLMLSVPGYFLCDAADGRGSSYLCHLGDTGQSKPSLAHSQQPNQTWIICVPGYFFAMSPTWEVRLRPRRSVQTKPNLAHSKQPTLAKPNQTLITSVPGSFLRNASGEALPHATRAMW